MVRYLPYKLDRYTGVLSTWNGQLTPNLIFKLIYQLVITLPKIIVIGLQGRVLPIVVKLAYWCLEDMEHPIYTKFSTFYANYKRDFQ